MKKSFITMVLFGLLLTLFSTPVLAALPEGVPEVLEAPVIKGITLEYNESQVPYFEAQVFFPQSVLDLDTESPAGGSVFWDYAVKVDDGEWEDFGGGGYINVYTGGEDGEPLTAKDFSITFDPIDEGTMTSIDIKSHVYTYKIRVYYDYFEGWPDITPVYSPASNTVTIGTTAYYSKAHDWAKEELDHANNSGLIPAILLGSDMTMTINREEFAELAVQLYEKVTGTAAVPVTTNPFKDTTNPQILKAFALGITYGTSTTTFEPKLLINREQCAAMLFRAIQAIKPTGDYSIVGVADFPDQAHISSWAVEATKYMSKIGIIKGDSAGNFMPKATTEAQIAAGYGMATREAAVMMTVRSYDNMSVMGS